MKTTSLKWIGLFLLSFILQTSIVPVIDLFGIHPDFPMIVLFFLAFKTGPLPATWAGFFLGLAQDIYSPSILGQNALSKTIAGCFAGIFNERMMRIDIVIQMILLITTFLISDICYFTVQCIKSGGGAGGVFHHLVAFTMPRALYSMAFALLPHIKNHFSAAPSQRL